MKKLLTFLILTYLLFTINSSGEDQNNTSNEKVLKIGVLLPLSGEFQDVGNSFLKSIQLALQDISNKNIKIYPKDTRGSPLGTFLAAKEFENDGIKIVVGPIFFENLKRLDGVNNITFLSFTNKTEKLPKNVIAFGININSQINTIKEYFLKNKIKKTILLSPKNEFTSEFQVIKNNKFKFHKEFLYDVSPKKITNEIEKLTKYKERKKHLERRILILEKSDLYKDKQELKKLEQKHTLGEVNFDSVLVVDFGERLKSILTSFMFSDVSSKKVLFFTVNQWFDKTFFNESALQNLHFPAINQKNLINFKKKYSKAFNENPNEVSILAYDAIGLIYYTWLNNNLQFESSQLYNNKVFKGLHGEFYIENNYSKQKLKIYKISKKKFIEVD
jgi:hypothetical protein